jgi:hypothetical protein
VSPPFSLAGQARASRCCLSGTRSVSLDPASGQSECSRGERKGTASDGGPHRARLVLSRVSR